MFEHVFVSSTAAYLPSIPVERLSGIGPVLASKLRGSGLRTAADVATTDPNALASLVGRAAAHHLGSVSMNRDPRVVETNGRRHSMSSQRTLRRGVAKFEDAERIAIDIVERVAERLWDADLAAQTVVLRMRSSEYRLITRSHSLQQATATTSALQTTARKLLADGWPECAERGVRQISISLNDLSPTSALQLALPLEGLPLEGLPLEGLPLEEPPLARLAHEGRT